MNFSGIQEFLTTCSKITDSNLDSYYKISSAPPQLIEALRYTSLSDGKKIRPALIYAAAETYYLPDTMVHDIACATELIHTYSLIHDDLPAMDNDDFRRGKPSAHKKFNEAIAILAGDAMHAFAFEILAKSQTLDDKQKVQIIALLSYTAGTEGMCGGQMLDIQPNATKSYAAVKKLHHMKTGSLISACIEMPLFCTDIARNESEHTALKNFSKNIGLCFQIRDDILDNKIDSQNNSNGKLTYPSVLGLERSKSELDKLTQESLEFLAALNRPTEKLSELTQYISHRTN